MSNLLINEPPLMVLPQLAVKIGLNEAIFLQQLHYWLEKSRHKHEGHKWIYNSLEDWYMQFPFWSSSTLRRTIASLEKKNLVVTGNFNKLKIDQTKWYRIDYVVLESLNSPVVQNEQMDNSPVVQNEQTSCSNWTGQLSKMDSPLPEITSLDSTTTTGPESEPSVLSPEPPAETLFMFYEANIMTMLSPIQMQSLFAYLDDFDGQEEIIRHAIKIACDRDRRSFGMVEKLLKEWAVHKLPNLDRVLMYEKEKYEKPKATAGSGRNAKPDLNSFRD